MQLIKLVFKNTKKSTKWNWKLKFELITKLELWSYGVVVKKATNHHAKVILNTSTGHITALTMDFVHCKSQQNLWMFNVQSAFLKNETCKHMEYM